MLDAWRFQHGASNDRSLSLRSFKARCGSGLFAFRCGSVRFVHGILEAVPVVGCSFPQGVGILCSAVMSVHLQQRSVVVLLALVPEKRSDVSGSSFNAWKNVSEG